jgi:hypothetical protein
MGAPGRLLTVLTRQSQTQRDRRLILAALILVALSLRLVRLGLQPLWWDEGWSLYFATVGVPTMLQLTAVDIHPPFYYLLLHLWIGILGSGVFSVRLLSVLVGTATVPLLYVVGRRLLGDRGGLLAGFLLAVSPFHIYYSQEVRMYGLVTLLGLAALHFALRWESESVKSGIGRLGIGLGYVVTATAALYTQYYAAFLLLALNLVVVFHWLRTRRSACAVLSWLGAQAAVVVLFLPWAWYAGGKLLTYIRFKVSVEQDLSLGLLRYVGRNLAAFGWGHAEGSLAQWWWLGLLPLAVVAVALGLVLWKRPGKVGVGPSPSRIAEWGLVIVVVALACGFAVNLAFPFNPPRSERLLLWALPAYLILFAAVVLVLARHRRSLAATTAAALVLVGVLSLAFFYTVPRYPEDDYRPVAERIRALGSSSDAILCVHPWQVGYFEAYIPNGDVRPSLVLTPRQVIPVERQLWADDPDLMAADLETLLDGHGRLWLPAHEAMGQVLERQIESYLSEHAYPTLSEWYGPNTLLSLFADGQPVAQPVNAQFGPWLTLDGVALSPGPEEAGWGVAAVDLSWQLSERPAEPYHLELRLIGPAGQVWARRDSAPGSGLEEFSAWPIGEPRSGRYGLLVPAGTPPGDYRVTLQVYRSEDVAVLPVTFEGGSGGEVTLGTIHVTRPERVPPVEALSFQEPLQVDFGDRLRLLGFDRESASVLQPGEAVEVDLFWQARVAPGEDYLPRLRLLDAGGQIVAEGAAKPVAGTYPTAWWRAGELVRDPQALPIPAAVAPGSYRLLLSLVRAADGQPVASERGRVAVDLGQIEVQGREHDYEPAKPQHGQVAEFGASVELVGYDLRDVIRAPGSPLEVTLYWHALETPDRAYHTFVHLLDAAGHILAQHDGPPGSGGAELPTLGWLPGETLVDTHLLVLPPAGGLPDGEYHLAVGLYEPVTGQRLGEQVILDTQVPVSENGCQCP